MLNQISEQQSNKVVSINENFEAVLPAALFGIDRSLSIGLLFAWYGGVIWNGSAFATIADGTIALSGSATNYIEADSAGTVYQNTTGFTAGRTPLYVLVTSSAGVTTVTDYRINNPAYAGGLGNFKHVTIGSGTLTDSAPALTVTQTWNDAADVFVGADMNITDTASDAASILQRWRVGGSVMASISKAGALVLAAGATLGGILALPAGAVGAPAMHFGDATTGLYRSAADQVGIAVSGANVGIFSSTGLQVTGLNNAGDTTLGDASGDTLTIAPNTVTWSNNPTHSGNHTFSGNLLVNGNATMGDASGDTLTVNAGTITYGANWTATRAAGALATGTQRILFSQVTYSGDAGGATNARAFRFLGSVSGANGLNAAVGVEAGTTNTTSATIVSQQGVNASVTVSGTGSVTNGSVFATALQLTSSGNVTTADHYLATAPTLSSTGAITTLNGLRIVNQGNSLVTTAVGVKVDDFTNSTNMRAVQLSLSSGANKWNVYVDGSANSAFAGNVRIGSTTAPTVALDITGALILSLGCTIGTTLTVSNGGTTATTGAIRLSNNNAIRWRNAGGTADISLALNASDVLVTDAPLQGAGLRTSIATSLVTSTVALNDGAGAGAGTLSNAPAAGNPTKWIPISDNGTTRYVPAW